MLTLAIVQRALTLPGFDPAPAQLRMAPDPRAGLARPQTPISPNARTGLTRPQPPDAAPPPKQAGVLALIFPHTPAELHIVLTRRNPALRGHSGQISFPGGRRDPDDASFASTALRETCEELGLCDSQAIALLGQLAPVYIPPTHYTVYPQVGYLATQPRFAPNPAEVAEVFTVPLAALLDDALKAEETRELGGVAMRVPYYRLGGHVVWGATATMLSELEGRLRAALAVAEG